MQGTNTGRDPRRESVPPLTAEESEKLWRLLQQIDDGQLALRQELDQQRGADLAWKSDVREKLEQHERDILELKKTTLAVGELGLEQKKANDLLTKIDAHNQVQDADLKAQRSAVDALVSEKKAEASAKKSKFFATVGAVCGAGAIFWTQCGPAILSTITPPNPPAVNKP